MIHPLLMLLYYNATVHSFLITGNSSSTRHKKIEELLDEWNVHPFDRVEIIREGTSIGIKDIRELQSRITLKPYNSPLTVVIVNEAHLLTLEAQQALLKTLEEPPATVRIILETPTPDALAPTILSRCQILKIKETMQESSDDLVQCLKTLEQLSIASIGERLKIVDEIVTSREETLQWVDKAIEASRQLMPTDFQLSKLLRGLLTARAQISANVNPKLSLDNLFISLSNRPLLP